MEEQQDQEEKIYSPILRFYSTFCDICDSITGRQNRLYQIQPDLLPRSVLRKIIPPANSMNYMNYLHYLNREPGFRFTAEKSGNPVFAVFRFSGLQLSDARWTFDRCRVMHKRAGEKFKKIP